MSTLNSPFEETLPASQNTQGGQGLLPLRRAWRYFTSTRSECRRSVSRNGWDTRLGYNDQAWVSCSGRRDSGRGRCEVCKARKRNGTEIHLGASRRGPAPDCIGEPFDRLYP